MKRIAYALIFVAGSIFAQQQMQPAAGSQDGATTVFPSADAPTQQGPPSRPAQPSDDLTTPEVRQLIRDSFVSEPILANSSVTVETNDRTVILSGEVKSEAQRDVAVQIAKYYAGNRQVVQKIAVGNTKAKP
jgi:osmotically-inducible protein OsmY